MTVETLGLAGGRERGLLMPGRKMVDLSDKQFNEWTVIRYLGNRHWECQCSCGELRSVHAYKLTSGESKSCGHSKNKRIDLTGKIFGDWTVIDYAGNHQWNCVCTCGKRGKVASKALRDGLSKSCGHDTTGFKNIKGEHFGQWEALEYIGKTLWKCRCSCGTIQNVKLYDLEHGRTTSCGHNTTGFIDLTNKTFGSLKAKEYLGEGKWLCECICGNTHIVKGQKLRLGISTSCGCMRAQKAIETSLERYGVPHSAQRGRTPEQVAMTSSPERLQGAIIRNFHEKPTPAQLGHFLGLTPHRVMTIIRSFKLENLVHLDKAVSRFEDELNELFPCSHRSERKAVPGYELDLYYPEHGIALEFNGNYWHSEQMKGPSYHQDKTIKALDKGIQIIHIFEYEWEDQKTKEKLIRLIRGRMESQSDILYARNCIVKEISNEVAIEFANEYHLQNGTNASINFGIYNTDELIGVMTFGAPRFNNECQYELIRLAWKDNKRVIGGAERLFKAFIEKYKPNSIISYCDISKFSGKVYEKLGFMGQGLTRPSYKWVDISTCEAIPRYRTQKKRLLELNLGTERETETDIMTRLGYTRIYDCGNLKFIWRRDRGVMECL